MLLAGATRELQQPVQSGDSPEGKTPPPWGVLCSQRGVDQLWAERVPGGLRKVRYKASRGVGAGVAVRPLPPFPPRPPASDRSVRHGDGASLWSGAAVGMRGALWTCSARGLRAPESPRGPRPGG